jgi:hypothetical protein
VRQKISTLIDPGLYRRVKLESVRMNKQISEIVGEALERYLEGKGRRHAGVVEDTWAAIRLPAAEVRAILEEEEEGLLDS